MSVYEKIREMSLTEMARFICNITNADSISEYCHYCSMVCERRQECEEMGECVEELNEEDIAEWFLQQEFPNPL